MDHLRMVLAHQLFQFVLYYLHLIFEDVFQDCLVLKPACLASLEDLHLRGRVIKFRKYKAVCSRSIRAALNHLPTLLGKHTVILLDL